MIQVRDFRPIRGEFDDLVDCYRIGFPEGHNRYSLARLVRVQRDSILVATDGPRVVGVIIGIVSRREAWFTGMTVLPERQYRSGKCSLALVNALAQRFLEMGYVEAFATTCRKGVEAMALSVGAELIGVEDNFYFDGESRSVFRAEPNALPRLAQMLAVQQGS